MPHYNIGRVPKSMEGESYRNLQLEEGTEGCADNEGCELVPLVGGSLQKCKFKMLRLLLLISGLSSQTTAIPLAVFLSSSAAMLIFGYSSRSFLDRQLDWTLLCHLVFAIHGATVYSLLAKNLHHKMDIFSVMGEISQPMKTPLCKKFENSLGTNERSSHLEYASLITSSFVVIAALANFIAIWLQIGNPIAIVLEVSHTIPLKILSLSVWIFFCFGWFLPVAIVCPPTYFVLQQILAFEKYIENHLSENCNIDTLMHWYNELYDTNVLLQKAFGSLVTMTIVIGGIFQIILIMVPSPPPPPLLASFTLMCPQELFVVEMDCLEIIARIGFCVANAVYVLSVSSAVASLDSVNRRLVMILIPLLTLPSGSM
jgi:hypothetical protein